MQRTLGKKSRKMLSRAIRTQSKETVVMEI